VKKEAVEVVEMSGWRNLVKPQATKVFQRDPRSRKRSSKKGAQNFFVFSKFDILKL
jgi:hypothetical protein